ncbi:glutaredoxin, partial [Mycobacterium tuberculosis]|uniref:glutaredoxin n=1 Tax=Mycobacterium tuberculosis TaxID=1773 RepID=UPI0025509F03
RAKNLLKELKAKFLAIEMDQESDGAETQAALQQISGQRTVPNIFIGGKHIGGCDDLMASNSAGKLVPLLTEAGALAVTA